MQSGLLPASSLAFAARIAATQGASLAAGGAAAAAGAAGAAGSAGAALYGLGGSVPAALQGLEWALATSKTPGGLLKTQVAHLWHEMQSECLQLLSQLLHASLCAPAGGGGGGTGTGAAAARCVVVVVWVLCGVRVVRRPSLCGTTLPVVPAVSCTHACMQARRLAGRVRGHG
jgi:hypothetical protein